jgi:hypothetical protein
MLSALMLSVTNKPYMLCAAMLSVNYDECRYAESRGAVVTDIQSKDFWSRIHSTTFSS